MNRIVGQSDLLFITFDCLRLDVARRCHVEGRTPTLSRLLGAQGWEARETPGTFTLAAHLAFFHGFLPTPLTPGPHPRLWALDFEGSLTIAPTTYVFSGVADILAGFHALGYRSFCVGGVGFFNKRNPLGHVLPNYFQESVWSSELGVTCYHSTRNQVREAITWLRREPHELQPSGLRPSARRFLFLNISATHPPHAMYLSGATQDSIESQMAALAYADSQLGELFDALGQAQSSWFCLLMGDHGEARGEDGRFGHRIAHPTVTTVPYAHFLLV
jgi:hypothetical protein